MQALAALALQGDVLVAEERLDEGVHAWLLEPASLILDAGERRGALDVFLEEVRDICMQKALNR